MNTNHYKQHSIKLLGIITLVCFALFLSSCGTENDENFEMPSEEVLERVSAATEVAGKYFSECSSISELEKHLDEIRNTEGVVDVWTDDKTMYVKYEGFGTITYYYPIISATDIQNSTRSYGAPVEFESLSFPNAVTYSTRSEEAQYDKNHYRLNDSEKHSLVIYNALSVDERFKEDKEVINNMENTFKAFNYSTECIETSKDISQHAKFFNEDLYKYDIVVFDCHGFYYNKKHWLLTGCLYKAKDYSLTKSELEDIEKKANLVIKNHKREDYLSISLIEEKVNGIMRSAFYWSISEDFLSLNGANFNERSIVFNCACESLMGSSTLADIFCNKGAACYLGYDNTNCISMLAAEVFFQGLLNGFTVQSSYGMLEKRYTNDTSKYYEDVTPGTGNYIKDANGNFIESAKGNYIISRCNANLEIVTKNNNEDDKHVCITHPQTDSYEDKDNNYYVKLKGHIKIANPNNNNEYGFALRDKNSKYVKPLKPGIKYSNADISTGNCSYDKNTNTLNFECTVSKSDFKDVDQFCAYLYDGVRYCLGDIMDIEISKAYAEYKRMSCPDGNHPHMIDLGLPSGTRWACCNLGANMPAGFGFSKGGQYAWGKPDPYEDIYAWGFDPRSYYGYNEVHGTSKEDRDVYTDIGKNISGTEHDAAYVYNNTLRMPTKEDVEELIESCVFIIGPICKIDGEDNSINRGIVAIGPNDNKITLSRTCGWTSTLSDEESTESPILSQPRENGVSGSAYSFEIANPDASSIPLENNVFFLLTHNIDDEIDKNTDCLKGMYYTKPFFIPKKRYNLLPIRPVSR